VLFSTFEGGVEIAHNFQAWLFHRPFSHACGGLEPIWWLLFSVVKPSNSGRDLSTAGQQL